MTSLTIVESASPSRGLRVQFRGKNGLDKKLSKLEIFLFLFKTRRLTAVSYIKQSRGQSSPLFESVKKRMICFYMSLFLFNCRVHVLFGYHMMQVLHVMEGSVRNKRVSMAASFGINYSADWQIPTCLSIR